MFTVGATFLLNVMQCEDVMNSVPSVEYLEMYREQLYPGSLYVLHTAVDDVIVWTVLEYQTD